MNRGNLYMAAAVLLLGGIGTVAATFSHAANPASTSSTTDAAATNASTSAASPFRKNVKVDVDDKFMIVHCDGIPDHTTGDFPNRNNPNKIAKQDYTFKIPLTPNKSDKITKLPMGPIGVAINGVPLFVNTPR